MANQPDPSPDDVYEPTDDELLTLAREAFAGVKEANRRTRQDVDDRIAVRRAEALAKLEARRAARGRGQGA